MELSQALTVVVERRTAYFVLGTSELHISVLPKYRRITLRTS